MHVFTLSGWHLAQSQKQKTVEESQKRYIAIIFGMIRDPVNEHSYIDRLTDFFHVVSKSGDFPA
jgi:hypothetical protein